MSSIPLNCSRDRRDSSRAGKEELIVGSLKLEAHDLGGHDGGAFYVRCPHPWEVEFVLRETLP